MNVRQLIDRLAGLDPDAEVLLATHPGWPMQNELMGVASAEDVLEESPCEEHDVYSCPICEIPAVVYLVEGSAAALSRAPHAAWEVAR